jgi:hypothetical protein
MESPWLGACGDDGSPRTALIEVVSPRLRTGAGVRPADGPQQDKVAMGRRSRNAYDFALGKRECETGVADTFEAEFPVITGRPVEILSVDESPDRVALVGDVETGIELTAIKADSPGDVIGEILRLTSQKHESYERRGIFNHRPIFLLGHLDWPAKDVEGPALYDMHAELAELIVPSDFDAFGFSEVWLMDDGPKYTSRRDPRAPADFFCFAPAEKIGLWERERKRRPYWGLVLDFLT